MASISNTGYVCFRIGVWNLLSVAHLLKSVTGQLLYIKVLTAHDLGGLPSVVFQFRSIPLGRNVEITFVWLNGCTIVFQAQILCSIPDRHWSFSFSSCFNEQITLYLE